MVIYARGGSKGTAVEAVSRTGRRESAEKLLVKSLHFCLFPLYAAPESQSLCVWVQLCITVRLIKGTDTRLLNKRKYNMNVRGVHLCFICSLLKLFHFMFFL